jgi:hypothetical protein
MVESLPRVVACSLLASLLLASCTQAPTESRITANAIVGDGLEASELIATRTFTATLIAQPLADAQSRISPGTAAALSDPSTREVFSHIVGCALPADATLVATIDGFDIEFFGGLGLAPQWRTGPLNVAGQRWVSACMFAKLNGNGVHIPISIRGPNVGLALGDGERDAFTLEEGAFYGNMFGPLGQPMQWYACRGRDLAAGTAGDLVNRGCAAPDPNKPSLTKCGLFFAGDCGSFAADQACESFSTTGTYYQRCHTAPIHNGPSGAFDQVITTFVLP